MSGKLSPGAAGEVDRHGPTPLHRLFAKDLRRHPVSPLFLIDGPDEGCDCGELSDTE